MGVLAASPPGQSTSLSRLSLLTPGSQCLFPTGGEGFMLRPQWLGITGLGGGRQGFVEIMFHSGTFILPTPFNYGGSFVVVVFSRHTEYRRENESVTNSHLSITLLRSPP